MFKKLLYILGAIGVAIVCPQMGALSLLFAGVTMVSGDRATDDLTTNRIKVDMGPITLLNPNKTPFLALISRLGKRVTINPKYWWNERQLLPRYDTVNGTIAAGDLTLVVDNGGYFSVGDLLEYPPSGEVLYVSDVSTNDLTVTRGVGDTEPGAITDGETVQIIGNANEEGATKRTLKTTQGSEVYNYTQIFRNPFGVTNTELNSETYGGKDMTMMRKEVGMSHNIDLNRAAWFGERVYSTSGTHPIRYTRGFLRTLEQQGSSSRITDQGGALSQADFETWLRSVIENDPDATRVIFVSRLVASVISQFAHNQLKVVPKDKTYGINVTRYISPMGEFNLVQEPLLKGDTYGGYAVAVVLKECKYRPLQNRDTKLITNIQDNSADTIEEEYLTEAGFQFMHPDKHAILKGVTG